jgi:aconitate hydratase
MDLKIASLAELGKDKIEKLPFSIRILLENVLRNKDNFAITQEHVDTLLNWDPAGTDKEVPFKPARVLMQDFTGVPAVVDIASIRSEAIRKGKDGSKINPLIPVDLVIDHSVQVDFFGTDYSLKRNVDMEYERNLERYQFLKWAQKTFQNFTVVPPGMGICHQVNLEYLATGIVERDGWAFPDTLVGTDSHTPMVNGIGVVGWGVGGIEAEAAILGQPLFFTCPQVIGLKLSGKLPEGITATDMVLEITQLLRKYGVVGKFVEVFGSGLDNLSVTDRATISNMSPEFGCTVTYFPIDAQTIDYMQRTNRSDEQIKLVEEYTKSNMLWRDNEDKIVYSDVLELNLDNLKPNVAGPKRPQDKILVEELGTKFHDLLDSGYSRKYVPLKLRKENAWLTEGGSGTEFTYGENTDHDGNVAVEAETIKTVRIKLKNEEYVLSDGAIAIAAITSCTNTSNPNVMLGAGLVARKAIERGLQVKPWVKTSLAPGSKVVTEYLQRSGLLEDLEALKFHLVGYGCTSCIGNSGPLPPHIDSAADKANLILTSVVSGNRNFEARIHPKVKMNFLASPMLVVAYALVGRVDINILEDPLGYDPNGEAVYLKDIWPTQKEINEALAASLSKEDFEKTYSVIFDGEEDWQKLNAPTGENYAWGDDSTYIKEAPFFQNISEEVPEPQDINNANVLLKLGDSVTTDHISPAGSFAPTSPAGKYLQENGVEKAMFNSYGSRRGNHEVMMRGTFANVRIKNELSEKEGGYTTYLPTNEPMSVYDAAMKYVENDIPLVIIGGKEYGSGSSRDWAAKGTALLGVKAVIVESFERIHRSNLVGMGVLPLEMLGTTPEQLGLNGTETYTINGISEGLTPAKTLKVDFERKNGEKGSFDVLCRLDSQIEIEYYKNGGILHYVLREFLKK